MVSFEDQMVSFCSFFPLSPRRFRRPKTRIKQVYLKDAGARVPCGYVDNSLKCNSRKTNFLIKKHFFVFFFDHKNSKGIFWKTDQENRNRTKACFDAHIPRSLFALKKARRRDAYHQEKTTLLGEFLKKSLFVTEKSSKTSVFDV